MTAVAAPAPDDEAASVERVCCACGEIAADIVLDDDGVVTVHVRPRCPCVEGVRS